MAYSLKVTNAKRDHVIVDGTDFIDVEFKIYDGTKAVETRKQGFAVGTSEKEIQATLKRYLAQYVTEKEQATAQAERVAASAADDKTINSLSKFETEHENSSPKRSRKG